MKSSELLDHFYRQIEGIVLCRQHPVTGLLPASTAVNTHGDYTDAWVRDNVYSIVCVWSLGLAYKRSGNSDRSDELEQACVKLMRGLLQSMMRQSYKVEKFKKTLHPHDALHAKYDTATGLPVVADDAWGHLQIDATSLFLLMLGQMTGSGYRIIRTFSEVDFVQNLIYYVASAYRTPDYGIWERGNKINNGKTEINASSVGMAKAALQALDGLNLFGPDASPRAVVHTVADSISLARNVLASLLPRESLSKEVDSALLSVIGFPAFAVGDDSLVTKTRDEVLKKLGGNYGCKRFLWDGHQTVVEESSRIYYNQSELANFEHIESEWPLFFTYLYLNALFDENETTAAHYRKKLESVLVEKNGFKLLPELYFIPEESIDAERKDPGSQKRLPNENIPLVWAQSLYLTGLIIDEGLLDADDLDPLNMRRRSTRFVKTQVALVVLAENDGVKKILAEKGVIAESLDEIAPVAVISAPHLAEAYAQAGANEQLRLTGRPARRLQSLATSQTYDINGKPYLCLSWLQSDEEDYRLLDGRLVSSMIEREISHIRKHWLNKECAVFTFMVPRDLCESPEADHLFDELRSLQLRSKKEYVGYASASLAHRASRRNKIIVPKLCLNPIRTTEYQDTYLATVAKSKSLRDEYLEFVEAFCEDDKKNYVAIKQLLEGKHLTDSASTLDEEYKVSNFLFDVYRAAQKQNHWLTTRYCFAVLGKFHQDLSDGVVVLASAHIVVAIGHSKAKQELFATHMPDEEIVDIIRRNISEPVEQVLLQEILEIMGSYARTNPLLFDGLRTIQLHNFLMLCAESDETEYTESINYLLGSFSPNKLMGKVKDILDSQRRAFDRGLQLNFSQKEIESNRFFGDQSADVAIATDWLEWRNARGLITRLDKNFLTQIWQGLAFTPRLIIGNSGSHDCILDSEFVRSSMTSGEESFARLIDELTQHLHPAYYKSAILETLYGYTVFCQNNPDVKFDKPVVVGEILEEAAKIYVSDCKVNDDSVRDIDIFIEQSPHTLQEFVQKVFLTINS